MIEKSVLESIHWWKVVTSNILPNNIKRSQSFSNFIIFHFMKSHMLTSCPGNKAPGANQYLMPTNSAAFL